MATLGEVELNKSSNCLDFCDEDAFNPDYVEVDRVLDTSSHTDPVTNITIYNF